MTIGLDRPPNHRTPRQVGTRIERALDRAIAPGIALGTIRFGDIAGAVLNPFRDDAADRSIAARALRLLAPLLADWGWLITVPPGLPDADSIVQVRPVPRRARPTRIPRWSDEFHTDEIDVLSTGPGPARPAKPPRRSEGRSTELSVRTAIQEAESACRDAERERRWRDRNNLRAHGDAYLAAVLSVIVTSDLRNIS